MPGIPRVRPGIRVLGPDIPRPRGPGEWAARLRVCIVAAGRERETGERGGGSSEGGTPTGGGQKMVKKKGDPPRVGEKA